MFLRRGQFWLRFRECGCVAFDAALLGAVLRGREGVRAKRRSWVLLMAGVKSVFDILKAQLFSDF